MTVTASKPTYNHAFSIVFEVSGSTDPNGEDVTGAQLRAAILRRLQLCADTELVEACGAPFDTHEERIARS